MSIEATAWAWKQHGLHPSEKLTLMALADYANHEHATCFPRVKRLAQDTDLSERAVASALSTLEKRGLISREHRRREDGSLMSNLYHLLIPIPPGATNDPTPGALSDPTLVLPVQTRNPVPEPEIFEPVPEDNVPTRRITKIDSEFMDAMTVKYRDRVGPVELHELVSDAMGHISWGKWHDKRRYVENWIKRALEDNHGRGQQPRASETWGGAGVNHERDSIYDHIGIMGDGTPRGLSKSRHP